MRTPLVVLLLLAGCTKPAPVAAPAAPVQPAAPPPAPAAVTCGDAGVLLRGNVDDQRQAGPAKEAAIARTCRFGQWAAEVLACVGERPAAKPCLDKLTSAQRTAYDQSLATWNEAFPDETLEEPFEGIDESGLGFYIDCSDAIQDASGFAPAVKLTGDDRDYALALRKGALLALCEDWEMERRGCFRDLAMSGTASNTTAVDACRAQLEPAQSRAVTDKLTELDKLAAKITALKKSVASHDCKKVAATHYADAEWKGKLDAVKGAERAKMIADSRARMTKVCTDDKWAPSMRACIVAGGGDECFTSVASAGWGFPALGVFVKTGLAECDAYAESVKAADACSALSAAQRESFKRMWSYLITSAASAPADRRAAIAQICKQNDETVRRIVSSAGCKI
jgi:hypothetical protein